jgi:hypothetical protein
MDLSTCQPVNLSTSQNSDTSWWNVATAWLDIRQGTFKWVARRKRACTMYVVNADAQAVTGNQNLNHIVLDC